MQLATLDQLDTVVSILHSAPAELTPMPTRGYIASLIKSERVVLSRGVVIMFVHLEAAKYYGVPLGFGGVQIQYLCATTKGDGSAREVFTEFLEHFKSRNRFLLVRSDNARAIAFYAKYGFRKAKSIRYKTFTSDLMVLPKK